MPKQTDFFEFKSDLREELRMFDRDGDQLSRDLVVLQCWTAIYCDPSTDEYLLARYITSDRSGITEQEALEVYERLTSP